MRWFLTVLVFDVGMVLSPLRVVAAPAHLLIAWSVAKGASGTTRLEEPSSESGVRRTVPSYTYDPAVVPTSGPENLFMGARSEARDGYDRTSDLSQRRQPGAERAICTGRTATTAAEAAPNAYSVAFEARLTEQGIGTYASHFVEANEQLLKAMADPETANALKATLGADFEGSIVSSTGGVRGVSPAGWTWHHVPDQPGVLQLVPGVQHAPGSARQPLLHPGGVGGMSIWGSLF
jgi:A nuclease of the HNH/ENDO VII superfamily with conserved WHH